MACVALSIGLHAAALWAGFSGVWALYSVSAATPPEPRHHGVELRLLHLAATPKREGHPTPPPSEPTRKEPPESVTLATTRVVSSAAAPAPLAEYLPPDEVEKPALPITDFDAQMLNGMVSSGLPIRLRVYIDAQGHLADARGVKVLPEDDDAVARLTRMLRATRFTPAKKGGRDVASFHDLEFTIEDLAPFQLSAASQTAPAAPAVAPADSLAASPSR